MDWNETKKNRCRRYLTVEYTSSDESELSEDESGADTKRFVTKRLAWESSQLRELKDNLDLQYRRLLSPHVRNFQTQRVVGDRVSLRGPPPNASQWALNGSVSSGPLACSTPARGAQ